MDQSVRNRRRLISAIAGLAALFVVALLWVGSTRIGRIEVQVVSVPPDARIYVDGKRMLFDTFFVEPGVVTIRAEKEGFKTTEKKVDFTRSTSETENRVPIFLSAESEEAIAWSQNNQALYQEAEGIAGAIAQQDGEAFRNANPIINLLPYADFTYRIDYGISAANVDRASIKVTALGRKAQALAIAKIREWGYEPSDLEIVFVNSENPFESLNTESYGE